MIVLPTKSDELLLRIVEMIVFGLKIIGLAPFSIQRIKNLTRYSRDSRSCSVFRFSKIGLAYNVSLTILFIVMGALGIPYVSSMKYPEKFSMTQVIDVLEVILGISASCVIIVSAGFRQKKSVSIMNRLFEVDCLLSDIRKHPAGSKRTSFTFLVIQGIFNVLLWVTFWATEQTFASWLLPGSIYNAPLFVIYCFFVEYSIVLALLTSELESLNTNLSDFDEFPNYFFRTPVQNGFNGLSLLSLQTHSSQLATLKVLRNIRITLSEVSEEVAGFFSISILFGIAHFSVVFVYNIYYLVITIVSPISYSSLLSDINTVTWILIGFYPLILLSFNVTQTLKEAKLTGSIIHKALARTTEPEIERELERFSRQLTDENLSFTAHGFFSLDFTLIQSILGTTATYLVIMIQFMQSAVNTSKNADILIPE